METATTLSVCVVVERGWMVVAAVARAAGVRSITVDLVVVVAAEGCAAEIRTEGVVVALTTVRSTGRERTTV